MKPAVAKDIVLTVDEVAELMRCNRKTVYTMVRKKRIPGVRHAGRCPRIHRETFMTWLAKGEQR